MIADVFSVIKLSILSTSIVKSFLLISQNIGVRPLDTIAWVVDANVKGVVIISPLTLIS